MYVLTIKSNPQSAWRSTLVFKSKRLNASNPLHVASASPVLQLAGVGAQLQDQPLPPGASTRSGPGCKNAAAADEDGRRARGADPAGKSLRPPAGQCRRTRAGRHGSGADRPTFEHETRVAQGTGTRPAPPFLLAERTNILRRAWPSTQHIDGADPDMGVCQLHHQDTYLRGSFPKLIAHH